MTIFSETTLHSPPTKTVSYFKDSTLKLVIDSL